MLVEEFILTKTSSLVGLLTMLEWISNLSSDWSLITQVEVSVVPLKTFVEFDRNPNGSKKCSLNINDETIDPLFCVYVHLPVSAPDNGGYGYRRC